MKSNRSLRPLSWLTGLLLGLLLSACTQPRSVAQEVIATIEQMDAQIEAGERRAFMQHIADDFTAQEGRMTRDEKVAPGT